MDTAVEILGFLLVIVGMAVGVAGSLLPALPGPPIVFLAALGHKLVFWERSVPWWVIGVMGGLMLLSLVLDFVATSIGAKTLGATWRGAVGAAVGGVVGFFFMPIGLVLGPLLGAVLLELGGGRKWREAGKAGIGAVVGLVAGTLGKLAICLAMGALFVGTYLIYRWDSGQSPVQSPEIPVASDDRTGILQDAGPGPETPGSEGMGVRSSKVPEPASGGDDLPRQ
jgi:uncharacterized protein YqgC (DUF456 family)